MNQETLRKANELNEKKHDLQEDIKIIKHALVDNSYPIKKMRVYSGASNLFTIDDPKFAHEVARIYLQYQETQLSEVNLELMSL